MLREHRCAAMLRTYPPVVKKKITEQQLEKKIGWVFCQQTITNRETVKIFRRATIMQEQLRANIQLWHLKKRCACLFI
jgi:hypothetical protein